MRTDKLTHPKIRQAKPADKPYKLFESLTSYQCHPLKPPFAHLEK